MIDADGGTSTNEGLRINADQTSGGINYGLRSFANAAGTATNVGVYANATDAGSASGGSNYGFKTDVNDAGTNAVNYGLHATVGGTNALSSVGVQTSVTGSGAYAVSGFATEVSGGSYGTYGLWAKVHSNVDGGTNYGVRASAEGSVGTETNYAVWGTSINGTTNYGVWGYAYQGIADGDAYYGVRGEAHSYDEDDLVHGVHAVAPTSGADFYALYAEGRTHSPTGNWTDSDEMLKENIEDLTGGLGRVMQLQPKTYNFRTDQFGFMGLPDGQEYGLIAQELQLVVPELVRTIHRPADIDSLGNVVHPAIEFKAMRYDGLIPILISAVKEQNTMITGLQQQVADGQNPTDEVAALQDQLTALQMQMAAMQAQLEGCCASGGLRQEGGSTLGSAENASGDARKLLIQPNPFDTHTSLFYTLERSGRAQLLVNSADGKDLRVLAEAQREAGQYQFEWNTSDLAPGLYYVTLLLDGEPIVKKAVKVRM
ncbi:MAG: tail fiber domain-containing protein [Flavobacteriales bacterium]|nr:tail fiber domain-containing protein [Flavobacteriales bacterium]